MLELRSAGIVLLAPDYQGGTEEYPYRGAGVLHASQGLTMKQVSMKTP